MITRNGFLLLGRMLFSSYVCGYYTPYNLAQIDLENIDKQDEEGKTQLHYAVLQNNIEAVEILLKNNANIALEDASGRTPLDCIFIPEAINTEIAKHFFYHKPKMFHNNSFYVLIALRKIVYRQGKSIDFLEFVLNEFEFDVLPELHIHISMCIKILMAENERLEADRTFLSEKRDRWYLNVQTINCLLCHYKSEHRGLYEKAKRLGYLALFD